MKKRGFLSIYVLIILLLLSISLTFIYEQAINNNDSNKDLYDRKKAIYELESLYSIIVDDKKTLLEDVEIVNENDDNLWHPFYFYYFDEKEEVKIQKQNKKEFVLRSVKKIGNSKAILEMVLDLRNKYALRENKKIILDENFDEFYKNLKFKQNKFEEFENLKLENDLENRFLKINNQLVVKEEKISSEISNDDNLEKNQSNLSNEEKNFSNKTKTPRRISGIVIIGKDLILENDLVLDGLLIIKGDIISKNNSKLTIDGQLISKNDYTNIVDYSYNEEKSLDYIDDIENPKFIEIKSKKVF
ncbi:MAG: hypothetical protein E7I57_08135 [Anaerococcus vaginalis]|uniref:hypothetical protein n=1 Tax=Anaerococcus vaginalis TaxID=33037 RepID=UPI00290E4994|nr:hypothetical protein [Anaerococcus vaginalis]MDU4379390.1 hypothetical protein [Anaerococcus vaginalis]MDU5824408.1 hypothetical protein [Anaerococcus vaginalis]